MKLCDLTQFYSPLSGGVKRYLHEKINYIQGSASTDEHVLIIPGPTTEVIESERSRIYSIHSPLVSRTSRYRALLNLRAIEEVLERERPDILESGDPYQVGWKTVACGRSLRIPVVGFYHSHFPEAYLRSAANYLGKTATEMILAAARSYVRNLYNKFEVTLVASLRLAKVLQGWGVQNVQACGLGVDTDIFRPEPADGAITRESLGIAPGQTLLLYVGRLAREKNTQTLFKAFALLNTTSSRRFHLLVIGDGVQRAHLRALQNQTKRVTWIQYCTDSRDLARYYRAADLFVHPGIQETFGLVALESQACGTPVIGIRGTDLGRIIFHEQELWAGENTPAALAEAIERLSAQNLERLGTVASRLAQECCAWPRVFERLFCIYREVCSKYKGS